MAEAVAEAKLAAPCETLFFARTWILAIGTCIFGSFAFFSLMMSPLFLFRIMKDAFGKPAVGAGIGLGVAGAFCLGLAALLFFQWNARRKPILQLFREGIKVHHIGPDSRSVSQYLPSRYRLLWQLISFEGFRSRTFYAPWKQFQNTQVAGSEMARYLRIVASFYELNRDPSGKPTLYGQALGFEETRLRTPLPQIAAAIHFMHRNADHRARLASWKE